MALRDPFLTDTLKSLIETVLSTVPSPLPMSDTRNWKIFMSNFLIESIHWTKLMNEKLLLIYHGSHFSDRTLTKLPKDTLSPSYLPIIREISFLYKNKTESCGKCVVSSFWSLHWKIVLKVETYPNGVLVERIYFSCR